jgi:phage shock protein PspC (stress-responsive transcriptional regulator)
MTDAFGAPAIRSPRNRLVLGLCGSLGQRCGVDPLWIRLGFVGLGTALPLAVVIYLAMWCLLTSTTPQRVLRVVGVAVLLVVGMQLRRPQQIDMLSGVPLTAWLLIGVAVSLWQPRLESTAIEATPSTAPPTAPMPATMPVTFRPPRAGRLRGWTSWEQSVFGAVLAVTAGGGVIDQLNGGRLHPEQWLGAGATVAGLGLAVSAWRGRGMWLVVPGIGLAAAAFVAQPLAQAGVAPWDDDSNYWYVDETTAYYAPNEDSARSALGDVQVFGVRPPLEPSTIDLTTGIGDAYLDLSTQLRVELRTQLHGGSINSSAHPNVQRNDDGTVTINPDADGNPLNVDIELGRGDVVVRLIPESSVNPSTSEYSSSADGPTVCAPPIANGGSTVMFNDQAGFFALGSPVSDVVVTPDGQIVGGTPRELPDGSWLIDTQAGPFLLTPSQQLIDPDGLIAQLGQIAVPAMPTPGLNDAMANGLTWMGPGGCVSMLDPVARTLGLVDVEGLEFPSESTPSPAPTSLYPGFIATLPTPAPTVVDTEGGPTSLLGIGASTAQPTSPEETTP